MFQLSDWWDNIPHSMREFKHFMCASYQKEPLNASTGYRGQKDDPSQWLSYGDAVYFAGDMHEGDWLLGFVPRPDDPFVIIDIDNKPGTEYSAEDIKLRDGLLAWALENTYVEKSSSGNGYHVVVSGAIPSDINRGTKRGVEAYGNRGFVILTGNSVGRTTEIAHAPDVCEWLAVEYGRDSSDLEVNDYYTLDQEQINNPPQWELDEDQKFLDSVSGWKNEKNIRSWFYAEDTGPDGVHGSPGDLALLQLFVKFSAKRKYPDESAMRMFLRSPRGRKLGRKNGQWMKYCMFTLGKAKAVVAADIERETENAQGFAEGVQNLMAGFQAQRDKHAATETANAINRAQGIPVPPVPNLPPIPYKYQFKFQKPAEILNEPPLKWALENVFQMRSVNAIYGWSGVGKSFVAIDMMFAFAQGKDWFGHEAEQLAVTYLALEGSEGLRNRLWAYMKGSNCTQLPDNIDIYRGKFNLRDREMVAEFCDQRKQCGAMGGVIFLDTFAKALPGADENSANDMGAAVAAAELLKEELNACVIIVHHSTKPNADTGIAGALRGSGAIQAGIDGVIQVAKKAIITESKEFIGYERFMVMDKAKEAEDGNTYPFELATEDIGERTRKSGEIVKVRSCHVVDLARQVNSRIAPNVANENKPLYSPSEYAQKPVRKPPKAGAKSGVENTENEANKIDWASLIHSALMLDAERTHNGNRGKHGAPPDKNATPRGALLNTVWELADPSEPAGAVLKKKLTDAIDYQVKSGKVGRKMDDGTQYFWHL